MPKIESLDSDNKTGDVELVSQNAPPIDLKINLCFPRQKFFISTQKTAGELPQLIYKFLHLIIFKGLRVTITMGLLRGSNDLNRSATGFLAV